MSNQTIVSTADYLKAMSKPVVDGIRRDYPDAAKRDYYAKQRTVRFNSRFGLTYQTPVWS